jgi:murein endopeptidase
MQPRSGDRQDAIVGRGRAAKTRWMNRSPVPALLLTGCVLAVGAAAQPAAGATLPDCHRHPSRSIGTPGNGRLVDGVRFPASGADHFPWNFREQRIGGSGRTRWGNCHVVRAVLRGLAAYHRRNPHAPRVAVGDMGRRHGGDIDGHSTHENGRQIDLYFPRRDRKLREPHTVAQVNLKLSSELVRAMLDAGAYRVLIGPDIHIPTPPRVMRWPHHDDHLHAMF